MEVRFIGSWPLEWRRERRPAGLVRIATKNDACGLSLPACRMRMPFNRSGCFDAEEKQILRGSPGEQKAARKGGILFSFIRFKKLVCATG